MVEQITKKALEEALDKKLGVYQSVVVEAMDFKFQKIDERMDRFEARIDKRMDTFEHRMDLFEQKLDKLTNLLENFLQRLTNYEEDFKILNAEMAQVKKVLKEKLGVDVSIYN